MPTRRLPLVVVLRVPGGERWNAAGVRIRDVPTSEVEFLDVSVSVLADALRDGRPVVATSPRAAGWLADLPHSVERGRVYCSGGRTARILASGGWTPVPPLRGRSGGEAVAERLALDTEGGVLHVRGADTAGTLEAALAGDERVIEPLVVYRLRERESFLPDEIEALRSCRALAVLAPSCLRVLLDLEPELAATLSRTVPALCGPTTAAALREIGWRDLRIAPEPSEQALLSLIMTGSVLSGGSR